MSNQLISEPDPDAADEEILTELQGLVAGAILRGRPSGSERCDSCRYYLEPDADLSYCWHPKLRILVGDDWWCQWWSEVRVDE
jgi:hypothetical protein